MICRRARFTVQAIPDLEDSLNKALAASDDKELPTRILVSFGVVEDRRLDRFGRLLFDWFRCPVLEVTVERHQRPAAAADQAPGADGGDQDVAGRARVFQAALHDHTRREWRSKKARTSPRYSFATLYDPKEAMPPSNLATLKHWSRVAEKLGVEIEPITRRDLGASPSSTRSSSARPRRSTITPTASPAAPCRKACRSSTIRSR